MSVVVRMAGAVGTAVGGTAGRHSAVPVGGASGGGPILFLLPGWLHHQGDVSASLGDFALLPWNNLCGPLWHRAVKWLCLLHL